MVRDAATAVAARHGLEEDWLNDAVKGFLPGEDPDPRLYFETPSLRVSVASPEYLLAMKLRASRVDLDADDIRLLYRLCGFTTVEEGLDLLEESYPIATIPPKVQYLLAEIVESLDADSRTAVRPADE